MQKKLENLPKITFQDIKNLLSRIEKIMDRL